MRPDEAPPPRRGVENRDAITSNDFWDVDRLLAPTYYFGVNNFVFVYSADRTVIVYRK
jgi:hypothetical protein